MIAMADAMAAVDRRLQRLTGEEQSTVVPFERSRFLCSGTDVPGEELLLVLAAEADDLLVRADGSVCSHGTEAVCNCVLETEIRGVAMRLFWLGFEFGKEDE